MLNMYLEDLNFESSDLSINIDAIAKQPKLYETENNVKDLPDSSFLFEPLTFLDSTG